MPRAESEPWASLSSHGCPVVTLLPGVPATVTPTVTLPDANFELQVCYQEALDWRKWTRTRKAAAQKQARKCAA